MTAGRHPLPRPAEGGMEIFHVLRRREIGHAGVFSLVEVCRKAGVFARALADRATRISSGWAFSAVVLAVALAGGLLAAPQAVRDANQLPDRYRQWLEHEVVYIIQAPERKAFLALRSDPERDKFIEQFWERRDPTPGTAKNEFKDEHYRRIEYADKRFGFSGTEGWRTDRGRIYIQYGPPDEIEAHPAADPPRQAWRYHGAPGGVRDFEFQDPGRDGRYSLVK